MNRLPDVEPVLRAYLADSGDRAPDRVLTDVAARIAAQPRRRTWRLRGRPFMNTYAKLVAAAAAVLIVGFVGWQLLPRSGVGPATPSAPPTPAPTATVTQSPTPTLGSGNLPSGRLAVAGHYNMPSTAELFGVTVAADVPAGWTGYTEIPAVITPTKPGANGVLIGFMTADTMYSDPCHWNVDGSGAREQPGDVPLGPTVTDVANALHAGTGSYTSTAPTDVTVGGFAAKQVELTLPGDDVLTTCDKATGDTGGSYIVLGGGFWAQGPNNIWRLYIVDVSGTRLVVMANYFADVPAADVTAADALIRSLELAPGT